MCYNSYGCLLTTCKVIFFYTGISALKKISPVCNWSALLHMNHDVDLLQNERDIIALLNIERIQVKWQ
jgi:hypothetical protein